MHLCKKLVSKIGFSESMALKMAESSLIEIVAACLMQLLQDYT